MSRALQALRSRGMLAATTSSDAGGSLDKLMQKRPSVYCGFDPTANSLHLGNLVQGIALRHFQLAGIRPILLVGGATGMIGDPSGKSEERNLLTEENVAQNMENLVEGLKPVLDFDCPTTGAIVRNNADWHTKMSAVDWMRDIGRHFRVNTMLARESVKKRLDSDSGISFLEFSYQLFQAYDFLHLYQTENCVGQLGGSDQWGNITAGCDLVRKVTGDEVYGITMELLTTASGEKYGKSAGNAIWLDQSKTSAFDFYQYFLRADDRDVEQLLKTFTFWPVEDIREIVEEHKKAPEKRLGQKKLAEDVTSRVHGIQGLEMALNTTDILFNKSAKELSAEEMLQRAGDAPTTRFSKSQVIGVSLVDLAVQCGACKTKAEARRLIRGGGVYINDERVDNDRVRVDESMLVDDQLMMLRTGRRSVFLVQIQP